MTNNSNGNQRNIKVEGLKMLRLIVSNILDSSSQMMNPNKKSQTVNKDTQRWIKAHEMRYYQRILNILYKNYTPYKVVRNIIFTAIGAHHSQQSIVKKKKWPGLDLWQDQMA